MKMQFLRDLYIEQLQDLYNAENQLIKALPKMAKGATSEGLRDAIREHLEVTRSQASRLEEIFSKLEENPKGKKCKGMEGLVEEGAEVLEEDMEDEVRDAALIAAAQRVEHYEIAGYGTVRTYATLLGDDEAAQVLQEILDEEKQADTKLTSLAEEINVDATAEGKGDEAKREQIEGEQQQPSLKKGRHAAGRNKSAA
jgi:ferritin-like metal-binding protein YciE